MANYTVVRQDSDTDEDYRIKLFNQELRKVKNENPTITKDDEGNKQLINKAEDALLKNQNYSNMLKSKNRLYNKGK